MPCFENGIKPGLSVVLAVSCASVVVKVLTAEDQQLEKIMKKVKRRGNLCIFGCCKYLHEQVQDTVLTSN